MQLEFQQVSYSYGQGKQALRDIDFAVNSGELLGVVGHTGSGKSTLLQLMNALLVPTQGRVLVDGLDTAERKNRREIRRRVGLAFQYPEQQLFASTVGEDVAFGPANLGFSQEETELKVRKALQQVGLDYGEFAHRSPFALSGGQKRRVALAGILAMEPQVLVLDEPSAGMDPATNAEIRDLVRSFNQQGMTVVLVSHSMDDVAQLCSRVLVLENGAICLQGTPAQVFSQQHAAKLEKIGLGLPSAVRFAAHLASKGLALEATTLTTSQLARTIADALGETDING